jgi:hypothetical protein
MIPGPNRGGQRPVVDAPAASPWIPEPPRRHSAALRISYGGCEWCGKPQHTDGTSCLECSVREAAHRERMNALAEREAELLNQLLEQRLAEHTEGQAPA